MIAATLATTMTDDVEVDMMTTAAVAAVVVAVVAVAGTTTAETMTVTATATVVMVETGMKTEGINLRLMFLSCYSIVLFIYSSSSLFANETEHGFGHFDDVSSVQALSLPRVFYIVKMDTKASVVLDAAGSHTPLLAFILFSFSLYLLVEFLSTCYRCMRHYRFIIEI